MLKNINFKKIFLISIAFLFLLVFIDEAFSRAGSRRNSSSSRSSYSSSRSSYSSGRSSYSSGRTYASSYGSSYGSGYGGSYYGSRRVYNSYYGSSGYYGGSSSFWTVFLILAITAVIIYVIYAYMKSGKHSGYDEYDGEAYGSGFAETGGPYGTGGYGYSSGYGGMSGVSSAYDAAEAVINPAAEQRIRRVFEMVQRAWAARDQYIARDCMSERMFSSQKRETDDMINDGERNVLENIRIVDIKIIEMSGLDASQAGYSLEPSGGCASARMLAYIRASMIDYWVDENGSVIDGNPNVPDEFVELWKFVMGPDGWVVDEIVKD